MTTVGGIYYTDNRIDGWPVLDICREQLKRAFDETKIVSVSLKPINLGKNIVLPGRDRSYPTMITQILMALEASTADFVFFLEHDVLYHPSHFDMVNHIKNPSAYTYNVNNWRWRWDTKYAITYNHLTSLSMMGCYREVAVDHYGRRVQRAKDENLDEHRWREPRWARLWGYEPGTKKRRRGGFSDEDYVVWRSEFPNIDIRHKKTFSKPKTTLAEFKHAPSDGSWKEENVYTLPGWNLKELFGYEFP